MGIISLVWGGHKWGFRYTSTQIIQDLINTNSMDVLISAAQGGGKTSMSIALAMAYTGASSWTEAQKDVYVVGTIPPGTPEDLAHAIAQARVRVVMFDESITCADDLRFAIECTKAYRRLYPAKSFERELLAIYCEQHGTQAIVLQFHAPGL